MKFLPAKFASILRKLKIYFAILIFMLAIGCVFYIFIRNSLLHNYQNLGDSIASNYASEVEGDLNIFRALISFGTENIDSYVRDGDSFETAERKIKLYYQRLQKILGEGTVDPYAVFQGKFMPAVPWEGDASYDYASSYWHKAAMEAEGKTVFTDLYIDAISKKPVVTIAKKCNESDAVLAFDVFPENILRNANLFALPPSASVYICDKNGGKIYANNISGIPEQELKGFIKTLRDGIADGSLNAYNASFRNLDGKKIGVYHDMISCGWLVIVTVPFDTMLNRLNQFALFFGLIMLTILTTFIFVTSRNIQLDLAIERTNETIRVLGNSYYALYRINYKNNTYEIIKGSDYVLSRLPLKGSYSDLLSLVGQVIEETAFKDFQKSFASTSIQYLVENKIRDYGGDFLRRFGEEYRWVSVQILFDDSLSPDEVVMCFREIDQYKRQKLQEYKLLEDALVTSRQSEKAKQSFFNNMSHDMRTPLNAILGLSDLVRRNVSDSEKVKSYIDKISYSCRQLLDLVNDILDMSRMQQGKVVLNNQAFDLKDCVDKCVDSFRMQAESENKILLAEYDVSSSYVLGDSNRINQILNNLLSNALKFTSEGDTVSIALRQLEEQPHSLYQLVIKDTGIGMSEEFLPHIFDPYARENRFSSKQVNGTGLGMPIVKSLVTQMSGQIYVESKIGSGTVFTVTIPFLSTDDPSVEKVKDAAENLASEGELNRETDKSSLSGKTILLAEDNLVNMEIATEILTMNGLKILQAWNGAEALDIFRSSIPFEIDAVLMDMQMPQMDGCEAARRIRSLSRPDAKTVPIVAATANAFAEDIAATTAAGMNAHISKPIDFKVLCRTLERLIENKKIKELLKDL